MKQKVINVAIALGSIIAYLCVGYAISGYINPIYTMIGVNLIVCLAFFLVQKFGKSGTLSPQLKLMNTEVWQYVILFIVMFLSGQFTGTYILNQLSDNSFVSYQGTMNSVSPIFMAILVLIFAPLGEESLMRGIFFGRLLPVTGVWAAWIVQAVMFSIMHGTKVHIYGAFAMALFCGLIYFRTHRIGLAMLSHCIYNLASMYIGGMAVPDVLVSLPGVIIEDILVIAFLIYMMRQTIKLKDLREHPAKMMIDKAVEIPWNGGVD